MPATFSPAKPPSQPLEIATTPRILRPDFGDGYSGGIPDGINYLLLEDIQLSWKDISASEVDNIIAFMVTNVVDWFYYTLPSEGAARKFLPVKWSKGLKRGNLQDCFVTLKEQP